MPEYVLGYSESEFRRLTWQGEVLQPLTSRLLRMTGIKPGMRVLDVGCGPGDVALLAAEMVGPSGCVVGVDRNADSLELARYRADRAGLSSVRFHASEVEEFVADKPFDVVVGRYVLVHQSDPVNFMRAAGQLASPEGILAFHEMNGARAAPSVPEVPLWRQADEWAKRAISSIAYNGDVGSRLIDVFSEAGLPEPELSCEVPVGGGPASYLYKWLAEAVRSLLPVLSKLGVSPDEIGIDTLEDRLRTAVTEAHAQIEWNPQFLAIARRRTNPHDS